MQRETKVYALLVVPCEPDNDQDPNSIDPIPSAAAGHGGLHFTAFYHGKTRFTIISYHLSRLQPEISIAVIEILNFTLSPGKHYQGYTEN